MGAKFEPPTLRARAGNFAWSIMFMIADAGWHLRQSYRRSRTLVELAERIGWIR